MPRPMILAMNGWYPSEKEACKKQIASFIDRNLFIEGRIPLAAIVPHAGWYFSGKISINCIRILKEKCGDVKHVFIFGGHLSEANLAVIETFDYAETPFGQLRNDFNVINFFKREKEVQEVEYLQDNTIEVLLPVIYYFFGNKVTVSAIYLPPNIKIVDFIKKLYKSFGKNSIFIGSTDLTHYGPNYGFFHHDKNISASDWVKNKNDKGYIDLLLELNDKESLIYAAKNKSACSAGAVLGAMTVAKESGVKEGQLISYYTSNDVQQNSSFVGYAGIIY